MTILLKAAATGIAGAVLGMLLKRSAPELGLALSVAVCFFGALLAMELVAGLGGLLDALESETGLSPAVLGPVLKCVGVGIVTRLAADICRDAGQSSAASAVELCGAACALVTALPLIRDCFAFAVSIWII